MGSESAGSMRTSWGRHKSVAKLEDRFLQRHRAHCCAKKLLRQAEKQAKITASKNNAISPKINKTPTED